MELTERTRPDWCSWQLCRAVAARMRLEPDVVMAILRDNIERAAKNGVYNQNTAEWDEILETQTPLQIAELLEAETHESQRLRSNLRGMRVLTEEQRCAIIDAAMASNRFPKHLFSQQDLLQALELCAEVCGAREFIVGGSHSIAEGVHATIQAAIQMNLGKNVA